MNKTRKIMVEGVGVSIVSNIAGDYISLTDMLRAKDGDFFISDWLRNRNTVEYLGIWERINNPTFNYGEFAIIKSLAGLNSFKISVKDWVGRTGAIGIKAITGRYGGTLAHKDIAFEFGMWISPQFKLYLIKEFQRLKDEESRRLVLGWDVKRQLTKINYRIHTDAIKENLVPLKITKRQSGNIYASEADVLNTALFGETAKEWSERNKSKDGNMREYCDVTQLVVLANLEGINAELIRQGLSQKERLVKLNEISILQMKSLINNLSVKKLEQKMQ